MMCTLRGCLRVADRPHRSYGDAPQTSPHEVAIPSPWLRENNVDVLEVVHGGTSLRILGPLNSS